METFSALLALCAVNSPVTAELPSQRPVMRNFDVFFDLRLNKRLCKQWWGWRFETPSRLLRCHCNVFILSKIWNYMRQACGNPNHDYTKFDIFSSTWCQIWKGKCVKFSYRRSYLHCSNSCSYCMCWCPGDARCQGISKHYIDWNTYQLVSG